MSELVDAFLKHKGFIKERGGTNAPLMPNILADTLYVYWDENLKGRLVKESKKYSNKMIESYYRFNKEFFAGFEHYQTDMCVEAMDWFYEHVEPTIKLFRISVKNAFKDVERETKDILAHIAVCKLLASQANDIWGIIYKTMWGEKDRDNNLYGMYYASRELFNVYTRDYVNKHIGIIDLSNDPDIASAMKRFESKVLEFIRMWK